MKMLIPARATKAAGVPSVSEDGRFITTPLDWLPLLRNGTGSVVSEEGSLALPTIYACVRVLSEDVASLPMILYRRGANDERERATDHPLYDVFAKAPNPVMTSFTWRETMMTHLLTWGNAYSEIAFDAMDRMQLWPVRPSRVEVEWEDNQKVYYYLGSGGRKRFRDGSIFHVMGQSLDGLTGLSPIALHRLTLGEQAATRDFGRNFYRNNARPATVLKHPAKLSTDAQNRLKSQVEELKGAHNAGKTVVLEEGLDFIEIGIPPEDAQYIETRKLQREEAAQIYRMQQHKVGILDHATFSNIEHQQIDYVTGTLRPWPVRIEQAANSQLIEEDDVYVEILLDGLYRGDAKSRAEALAIRWQHGTLTPDQWRKLENENALPDGTGSKTYVPVNYKPVQTDTELEAEAEEPETPEEGQQFPPLFAVKSMAEFRCPDCSKLVARKAAPGTIGYCQGCKAEKTMAGELKSAAAMPTDVVDGMRAMLRSIAEPPVVNIPTPIVNVPPADVHVHTDAFVDAVEDLRNWMATPKKRTIERDEQGRIVGLVES